MIERGAEFILPGYEVMEELAARFGIPLVRKGTPYGRRIPVGEEAVAWSDLESAFERIGDGPAAPAPPAPRRRSTPWSSTQSVATLIKTRVAISNGHPSRGPGGLGAGRGGLDLRRLRQLHA